MNDELFPIASVTKDSPRLAWLKKHEVCTFKDTSFPDDKEYEPWTCYRQKDIDTDMENYSTGFTEHDAICDWAIKHGVKLWNEETK